MSLNDFYKSDRFSSYLDANGIQYVNSSYINTSNGTTWSGWQEDLTWKVSLNLSPNLIRYRTRVRTASFLEPRSLHHDVFAIDPALLGNVETGNVSSVVTFQAYSSDGTSSMESECISANLLLVAYGTYSTGSPDVMIDAASLEQSITSYLGSYNAYKKISVRPGLDLVTPWIWIEVSFVGDFISAKSFNQDTNQTSKVEHQFIYGNRLRIDTDAASSFGDANDPAADGDAYLKHVTTDKATIRTHIDGDFLQTYINNGSSSQINMSPIITKSIHIGSGQLLANQPLDFLNDKITTQLARQVDGAVVIPVTGAIRNKFDTWKATPHTFRLSSKVLEYSTISDGASGGGTVSYETADATAGDYKILGASIIQFNPYDSTWQVGLAADRVSFTGQEQTDHASYLGSPLGGNLPFILSSSDRRAILFNDPGRIPFFHTDAAKANQTLTDTLFKYQTTNGVLGLSAVDVPNLVIYNNNGSSNITAYLTPNSAQFGRGASAANNLGAYLSFYDRANISSVAKYSGSIIKLNQESFSIGIQDAYSTAFSSLGLGTSVLDVIKYDFGRTDSNNKLTLGNAVATLVIEQKALTNYLNNTNIYTGTLGSSTNMFGNVTMFADVANYNTEDTVKKLLTLRAAQGAPGASDAPLITGGTLRLTTTGLIESPTIDRLWNYVKRIVGGATIAAMTAESVYDSVINYDYNLFSEVSSVVSYPSLTSYLPFVNSSGTTHTGGSLWDRASTPRSLRSLEVQILKDRYNFITMSNYIKDRKVDKGTKFNDGQGSLITTSGASGNGTTATLTFSAITAAIPVGKLIVVSGMTPSGYNGTFRVTASSTTSVSYLSTATGAMTVAGTIDDVNYGSLWQLSNAESEFLDGTYTHINAGTDTTISRADVYLAADGTWQYLFDYVRIPILATASE